MKISRSPVLAGMLTLPLVLSACGADDDAGTGDGGEGEGAAAAECTAAQASASHHLSAASPIHEGLEEFARAVEEGTDGRVTIQVLSDAQLGGLAEMTGNLRSGGIEFALIDSGTLSQFDPELGLLDLPYQFDDADQFHAVMDGDFGATYDDRTRAVGVEPIFWSAVGARDMFFVDTEVSSAEELRGVQMRVPEAPVWVDTFTALGANPTTIPAADLYTSLDTGVVQGFELPLATTVDLKLHEPVEYWAQTGHMLNSLLIAAAPDFLDPLCEEDRQAIADAGAQAQSVTREAWSSRNEEAREVLEEELTVVAGLDVESFRDAVAPVHEDFTTEHGDELYGQLQDALGS